MTLPAEALKLKQTKKLIKGLEQVRALAALLLPTW